MFLYGWKLIPWSSHVYISSAGISNGNDTGCRQGFGEVQIHWAAASGLCIYDVVGPWDFRGIFFGSVFSVVHGGSAKVGLFSQQKNDISTRSTQFLT